MSGSSSPHIESGSRPSVPSHSHSRYPSSPPIRGLESLRLDESSFPSQNTQPRHYPSVERSQTDSQSLSPGTTIGLRRVRSDSGGLPGHRHSGSGGGTYNPPSAACSDIIAHTAADSLDAAEQQLPHPTEAVPEIRRGHPTRSVSGLRDRGVDEIGLHSAPGSYPTSSPVLGSDPLSSVPGIQSHLPPIDLGRGRPVSMPAYGTFSYGIPPGGIEELGQQFNPGNDLPDTGSILDGEPVPETEILSVSRPNIINTVTMGAGVHQRINEARFPCPVPGCGSTFSRHFALKGAFFFCLFHETILTCRSRSHALAPRREVIPVRVARVWGWIY